MKLCRKRESKTFSSKAPLICALFTYGSFFLWVRDVLHLYFAHTLKFLASKTILIWQGCVGALVFHDKPERKWRKKNPLKYFNFFIAQVRDTFVTSTLITFGYFFLFSCINLTFPFSVFLFVSLPLSYSTPGRKGKNSNNVFHWLLIFLEILLKIFKGP